MAYLYPRSATVKIISPGRKLGYGVKRRCTRNSSEGGDGAGKVHIGMTSLRVFLRVVEGFS
jgi:hypothetical protein